MKICPKCGAEYAEETEICPTDGATLLPVEHIYDAAPQPADEAARQEVALREAELAALERARARRAELEALAAAGLAEEPPRPVSRWRIAFAGVIVLACVVGGYFLYERNAARGANDTAQFDGMPALAADPKAKPVEAISGAPTGDAEKEIPQNGVIPSASDVKQATTANQSAPPVATDAATVPGAPPVLLPSPLESPSPNAKNAKGGKNAAGDPALISTSDEAAGAANSSDAASRSNANSNSRASDANANASNRNAAPSNANAKTSNAKPSNANSQTSATSAAKPTPKAADKSGAPPRE